MTVQFSDVINYFWATDFNLTDQNLSIASKIQQTRRWKISVTKPSRLREVEAYSYGLTSLTLLTYISDDIVATVYRRSNHKNNHKGALVYIWYYKTSKEKHKI